MYDTVSEAQYLDLVTNAWESITDNRGTIGLAVKTVSREDIPTSRRFPIRNN